jgi:hypothetical protein
VALAARNRTHTAPRCASPACCFSPKPRRSTPTRITDKGYVNQRATRERHDTEIRALYTEPPPPDVIICP